MHAALIDVARNLDCERKTFDPLDDLGRNGRRIVGRQIQAGAEFHPRPTDGASDRTRIAPVERNDKVAVWVGALGIGGKFARQLQRGVGDADRARRRKKLYGGLV